MVGFWIGAGLLAALALAFLVVPLWREKSRSGHWSASGLVTALAVVPVAVALYLGVSTYSSDVPGGASREEVALVNQLAERLVENPDDVQGWRLLGRSYMVLGEYRLARDAFTQAWDRTSNPDSELKLSLAEALIYTEPASIGAQAGDLVEDALAAGPASQRALWWGGVVAVERGQLDAARERWSRLLASNPPAEVTQVVQAQLAQLPGGAGAAAAPQVTAPVAATATAGPTLTLDVEIADGMPVESLGPNSYLFVFARAPGGGPPIAGARHAVDALPGTFTLSDADAIIAGRSLAAFPELTLVARISVNGDPIEQPGDLYAEARIAPGETERVALVIDRIVQAQ